MTDPKVKAFYTGVLQFSILTFTLVLVYFAFVYYPKAISDYKSGNIPQKAFVPAVVAEDDKFPIETAVYRITYEKASDSYYIFIAGVTLDQYLLNKNGGELALKNALELNSLCDLDIIYVADASLTVPQRYKAPANCD